MNVIEIKNLTKTYGKSRGVTNISLEVEEGEFFGFIGPNGAGKSTTIRTMLGLIYQSEGSVKILGKDIKEDLKGVLKEIGYLPSEAKYYPGMKVKEILTLSSRLHQVDSTKECQELCQRLNLEVNKSIDSLSFGNRKKVGIVCALQHNPKLIILDEPTSGLDPLMQKEFFDILEERHKKGATIFLSSHILSEIQHHCKRAAVIKEGEIIACEAVESLAKTNVRRVVVHGIYQPTDLENVFDLDVNEDTVSFLYGGDINLLTKSVSKCSIHDLSISEPDLEEIFMHFYQKEGK